jgi:cellobiose phosphorylase
MRYGYFDDINKEYVITRPDTPASWSNYLGSTRFGSIITNNAGGYSFFHSTAQGRITRLRFNNVPLDQPGKYIYIRDMETGDYWSASWQPTGKPLDKFETETRHGTAYTKIKSKYSAILSEVTYFVPLGKDYEVWMLKLKNLGDETKRLRLFTFVEFTCNWNVADDLHNLQYTQYITKSFKRGNAIEVGHNVNLPEDKENFANKDQRRFAFIALAGAEVSGYDTDREMFIGKYGTYASPAVVEKGACNNFLNEGGNPVGVLQFDVELTACEEKYVAVITGVGNAEVEGAEAIKLFESENRAKEELLRVKKFWHSKLGALDFDIPDKAAQSMLNVWNPYNCLITYSWSRAASLIYTGERDGLGYRDTVQDLLGVAPLITDEAMKRLELMITGQVSSGGAMPVVKPFAHYPGKEKAPEEDEYRSDDALWLFNTVPAYVKETGDLDFYNLVLPFADKGKATVFAHLKKAIEFNLERTGGHGLPSGLSADWNDALRLGNKGESIFVSFQLRYALKTYIEICELLGRTDERHWATAELAELDAKLETYAWDGAWYVRAFDENGNKIGSKENEEGKIFLNPQSWAVFSRHASDERGRRAMESANEFLASDYGLALLGPPYRKANHNVIKAVLFNDGMKENGAIFNHTLGWAVIAETILGNNERAYEYYSAYLPAAYNDRADLREVEPYVYCQSTMSKFSKHYGKSRLPWLTGTASWAYVAATQYIFGIRPDYDGLILDPVIPARWEKFKMSRIFRNNKFDITVVNSGETKRVSELRVNGKIVKGNKIPVEFFERTNKVEIVL